MNAPNIIAEDALRAVAGWTRTPRSIRTQFAALMADLAAIRLPAGYPASGNPWHIATEHREAKRVIRASFEAWERFADWLLSEASDCGNAKDVSDAIMTMRTVLDDDVLPALDVAADAAEVVAGAEGWRP